MFSYPRTLDQLLEQRAVQSPSDVVLISAEVQMTYAELFARVEQFALQLDSLGVQRGDRLGIHLHKSVEEVIATFAATSIGAVFVNINYQWTASQLRHVVQDCEIKVLVTDQRKALGIEGLCENSSLNSIVVTGCSEGGRFTNWEPFVEGAPSAQAGHIRYTPISTDLAALLYTSGSTGSPKGVMVTHANIISGAKVVSDYLGLNGEDRILSVPPLNFDYGLNQLMAAIWVGGTLVLPRAPIPSEILSATEEFQATVLPLVAPSWVQVLTLLKQEPLSLKSLRLATNTGGKIPLKLLELVDELLPEVAFILMYGLTEAFRSTYVPPHLFRQKRGAIGVVVPDNEVFVIDPDRGLCNANETGELVHRGSFVSRGYWGKPELSAEKIRPNPHLRELIGDELVVHSGDLVSMDEDGILWFVGRCDDMIKSSGFRMSPNEVEDIACAAAGISEAVAWGVEDEELGQVVYLAVYSNTDEYGAARLTKMYRKSMPAYMVPRKIFLFDKPMPRTANGKLDRPVIISQFDS